MKNIKYEFNLFTFFDKAGIENHLNKMAEKGWVLDKIGDTIWRYCRADEKTLRYEVTYVPDDVLFKYENTEEELTLREFCSHAGWEFIASWMQMRVFCNNRENPIPIETDPVLEVENIHSTLQKNQLVPYILLLCVLVPSGIFTVSVFAGNLANILSSNSIMFAVTAILFGLLYVLVTVGSYVSWYGKARVKAAEEGVFLERSRVHRVFNRTAIGISLLLAIICMFILGGSAAVNFIGLLIVMFISRKIVSAFKQFDGNLKLKKAVYIAAVIIMVLGVNLLTDSAEPVVNEKNFVSVEETVFLVEKIGCEDGINYAMCEIKMEAVRNIIYKEMFEQQFDWDWNDDVWNDMNETGCEGEFIKIDADAWDAEEAYQLYVKDISHPLYLIIWEDEFLKIRMPEEITQQQIIEVRNKFGK